MIIPMLCVTIIVILFVWFLLPIVARLVLHQPSAISIFVCLSMVQLMAVFICMRFFFQAEYGIRDPDAEPLREQDRAQRGQAPTPVRPGLTHGNQPGTPQKYH